MQFRRGRIFLVLVVVACGRETFDLLPTDMDPLAAAGDGGEQSAGGFTSAPGGAPDAAGRGDWAGEAGKDGGNGGESTTWPPVSGGAPPTAGTAGSAGSAGSAGAGGSGWGAMAGAPPDDQCDLRPPHCRPGQPSCIRCNPDQDQRDRDCRDQRIPICHPLERYCVECLPPFGPDPGTPCPTGETCDPATFTCRPLCADEPDDRCPSPEFPVCSDQFSLCVQCYTGMDCALIPSPTPKNVCLAGTCVECLTKSDCDPYPYAPVCVHYECRQCRENCDCEPNEWCDRTLGACLLL